MTEQKKRGTIGSQIAALKGQVEGNGDVLVKEYLDEGYSGAKMDRPGLNQLREDIKTDLFDVIYFLAADRIARDASYHTIIVGEILKENKQVIINGQDFKQNPENRFTLQILGAMAELERAKILERYSRGKMHKLRQGHLMNNGQKTYGYVYTRRNGSEPAKFEIYEREAKVVRYIFAMYAERGASKAAIMRYLEDHRIPTKTGLFYWQWKTLENILKNTSYMGIKYFNTRKMVREPSDPLRKLKYGKEVFRDRSEWLPVKVPPIISRDLFEKAQERFEKNKKRYMNPAETQLLSNLLKCGVCGRSCTGSKRFVRGYRYLKNGQLVRTGRIFHTVSYICVRRIHQMLHSAKTEVKRCTNSQVFAHRLEACVLAMTQSSMTDAAKLKKCLVGFGGKKGNTKSNTERHLKAAEHNITEMEKAKRVLLERYAKGEIDHDVYTMQGKQYDDEIESAKNKRKKLLTTVPALHQSHIVEASVEQYCNAFKIRLAQVVDFDSRRRLLLDYVHHITFARGKVEIHGAVPILLSAYADPDQTSEAGQIEFKIEGEINIKKKSPQTQTSLLYELGGDAGLSHSGRTSRALSTSSTLSPSGLSKSAVRKR